MEFQVTNYHSKKALISAIAAGKRVFLKPVPLTKDQKKKNREAELAGYEPPNILYAPQPFSTHEIQGSNNKQVPFYLCTVELDADCSIIKVY